MQPSAQGIASLFMGNPGALAARVDQDRKQSPMGIPDDLRQLMALNIVTTENDAAKRQQALSELQQMAPSGQPPTVAENVRQQAAQKLQAQMVQAQQKQQAVQQMMGGLPAAGIPQGVPQPERQPQGIDEAPVEFGMASGGIVSFQEGGTGKYETPYDRMNRENREREANKQVIVLPKGTSRQEADLVQMQNPEATVQVEGAGSLLRDIGQGIKRAFTYSSDVEAAKQRSAEQASREAGRITQQGPGDVVVPRWSEKAASAPAPAPAKDLKDLVRKAPAPAPAAPRLGAAEQALQAGAGAVGSQSAAQKALADALAQDPKAMRQEAMDFYKQMVPGPDFTQRDAAIKALQAERDRMAGPKEGFAGLAEYLSQIAATPRGMSSLEAGAAGARNLQAAQEARAQKRFDLGMKIVEQEQGKIDATRAYALETYNVGKKEFDAIFARQFEAAKAMVTDEREARKLAAEMTMRELEMNSREKIADRQIAAANARGEGRSTLTPAQRAKIADDARAAVDSQAKSNIQLQMAMRRDPTLRDSLIRRETERLMAAAEGRTMAPAPGAPSPGGTTRLRFDAQGNLIQ